MHENNRDKGRYMRHSKALLLGILSRSSGKQQVDEDA